MTPDLSPGRELDQLVAEKVMGWKPRPREFGDIKWSPSTDIKAAWEVVEKIGQIEIQSPGAPCNGDEYENNSNLWRIEHRPKGSDRSVFAEAETAPHCICLAALKAVGVRG